MSEEKDMRIYQCQMPTCGYMYMPTKGDRKGKIPAGTSFEDLPDTGVARFAAQPSPRSSHSTTDRSQSVPLFLRSALLFEIKYEIWKKVVDYRGAICYYISC